MTGPGPFQTRVFDGAHLRAQYSTSGHRRLIVTFDFRQIGKSDFPTARTTHAFDQKGYDQLRIQSRANDWFINPETEALEAVLAPLAADYARVRMIGYSMGGYGAFRFARTLNATHVFAVSPQVSIHPTAAPFDRRYRREAAGFDPRLGDIASRPHPGVEGFILTDAFDARDRLHARRLQELFPRVRILRLGFGGHPATDVITGAGQGFPVQRTCVMDKPHPGFIYAAHRRARRLSPRYWRALAQQAEAAHPALAARARAEAARLEIAPPPT